MSDPASRGWQPPPLAVVEDAVPASGPDTGIDEVAAARREGREAGYRDGLAEGLAAGRARAEALAKQVQVLLDALAAPFADSDATLLRESLDLTRRVAAAVLRRELQTDPGAIEAVLRDALAVLGDVRADVELTLHPEDARLCRELGVAFDAAIRVRESAAIGRGGLTLRSGSELIDATVDARLRTVIAGLYANAGLPEPELDAAPEAGASGAPVAHAGAPPVAGDAGDG